MSETIGPAVFGRVEEDGTVYVTIPDGERRVGQVPDVDPAEAMAFFVRRFESLETEVSLLSQRIGQGSIAGEDARRSIANMRKSIAEANAVGDLQGLQGRLDAFAPLLAEQSAARKAERVRQQEETKAAKEAMVAEAEKLAAGTDWRGGVNRFPVLLEEWKALPRIDKATDDELWHRFSGARTMYTRRRKAQFADLAEHRDRSRHLKESIIERARGLAGSTDWGTTASAFRDLMTEWKAAGQAPREVDEQLWNTFRGLQDDFFNARHAALNEQDTEFSSNQAAKERLLTDAEAAILPISDVNAAKSAFRDFLAKYNEFGKVPRDSIRPMDNRLRALEQAVREAEESEWRRTDPEARHRAQDTVDMFSSQIDKLAKQADTAAAKGDTRKEAELRESIKTYSEWRDQAAKALTEFSA